MINVVLNVILLSITVYTVVIGFLSFWFNILYGRLFEAGSEWPAILTE